MPRRGTAWAWFLCLGLVVIVTYLWLGDRPFQSFYYDSTSVAGVVAMVIGIRRNCPEWSAGWWLLVAGQVGNVIGDLGYFYVQNVMHDDSTPNVYDIPYMISYAVNTVGLLILLRRRNRGRDRAGLVDSLIIASAFALLSWVFLMKPVVRDLTIGLFAQLVALAYPTLDLLLLAMLAWLLTGAGPRNTAFMLVGGNIVGFLVGDYCWAFFSHTSYDPGNLGSRLIDCAYLISCVCFGAGALHPAMVETGRPVGQMRVQPMTLRRLALLAGATLIAPGLLTWQAWRNNGRVIDVYAIAIGCVTMFSAGVVTWNGVESGDDLVARADRALHRAKDAGRDRIEYDEEPDPA